MSKYRVEMSNGDSAEADTLEAMLLAARTLSDDVGGGLQITSAKMHGHHLSWLTTTVRIVLFEHEMEEGRIGYA